MAYTVVVTKKSVTKTGNFYNITLHVVVNDGVEDVLTNDLSAKYNPNAGSFDNAVDEIKQRFIAEWDAYTENKAIFDSGTLNTTVGNLQTQANAYVNQ